MELLVSSGIRNSTKRTYSSAQSSYLKFCSAMLLQPMPASERIILRYIAYLNNKKLCPRSLKVHLSAIRSLHIMNGLPAPPTATPRINLALRALLHQAAPPVKRQPITLDILAKMLAVNIFILLTVESSSVW